MVRGRSLCCNGCILFGLGVVMEFDFTVKKRHLVMYFVLGFFIGLFLGVLV
jgi:mannose/fructose/N-acetylgalactosamine-specific phosphotransferase system component IIC